VVEETYVCPCCGVVSLKLDETATRHNDFGNWVYECHNSKCILWSLELSKRLSE